MRILEFVGRKAVAILESDHDALTGLPNRLDLRAARATRARPGARRAVLYVDIDKIAAINEAFGLSAGDEVIQRVGGLVQRPPGAEALVSRHRRRPLRLRAAGRRTLSTRTTSPRGSSLQ